MKMKLKKICFDSHTQISATAPAYFKIESIRVSFLKKTLMALLHTLSVYCSSVIALILSMTAQKKQWTQWYLQPNLFQPHWDKNTAKAVGSLRLAEIFGKIAPFKLQRKLIESQDVCMSRSVLDPSWPQCRRLGIWLAIATDCPFAQTTQEPVLLSWEASGRFHTTWHHQTFTWI